MKEILDEAYAGKYGVPAFPGGNEIQVRSIIEAAAEANSPMIFLVYNFDFPQWNRELIQRFASLVDVPIAVCLDHSPTFEDCMMGIRTGVTAIMADRSTLPYEENVAHVSVLERAAHAVGVSIEAELGHVGQGNNYAVDGVSMLTDPQEAARFYRETKIDALAVAIGTAHGMYSQKPKIDLERLKDIDDAVKAPLVLHGGSGSGEDNIHRACSMGIAKVNIVTDILMAANQAAKQYDFAKGMGGQLFYPTLSKATKKTALHMFDVTGSTNKAVAKPHRPSELPVNKLEKYYMEG